ncbi:MAG: HAD-IIIA family hydrolase [Ilumatobacter sp.]|nr:HAD-IIIA family hydrolase [Ilumatobacter sp.]
MEIGYMVVNRDPVLNALADLSGSPDVGLPEAIQRMVRRGEVGGVPIVGGYHSISDPERLELTRDYLRPQKILLIDRDGVINEQSPRGEYVDRWDKFRFVEDTVSALETLSRSGFRFVVITNQAGVARGLVDRQELDLIHRNMVQVLARRGVEVVAVYVSPHHWNENSIMRKPEPGMFLQASGDLRFRLDRVLYIGDDIRDCQAAANAGCGMVFLGEMGPGETMPATRHPQHSFNNLAEAVPFIIDHYESERLR